MGGWSGRQLVGLPCSTALNMNGQATFPINYVAHARGVAASG